MSGGPIADTAVSRALLEAVASGEQPESLRVWVPDDALAFSIADRTRPGFARAVDAARGLGFEPFLRLTGGHAAVYTRQTLAFAWSIPAPAFREGIHERFEAFAALAAAALYRLGVDARVGEVAGEYCPGDHSINARGRTKLVGVGQRVIRGAAHLGGVIVVDDGARLRQVLEPVYRELGLDFDPETVGTVADEAPGITCAAVRETLLAEIAERRPLESGSLEPSLLAHARRFESRHRIDSAPSARADLRKVVREA